MIFDLHNDLLTSDLNRELMHGYIQKNSGNIITLAYWTSREKQPFKKLCSFIKEFGIYDNVRFAVEDIGFILADDFSSFDLSEFLKFPLLYCTLVWKGENGIAGGHDTDIGLSKLGREIVELLANADIAVDTAHLSERCFYDVVNAAQNVINSHCCLKSINSCTRNLSNVQISEIIDRDGIIGIAAVDDFFGKEKGIDGYIRTIDTFVQIFGCDSLCIGTDFYGTAIIKDLADYNDFDNLTYRLQNLGYKTSDIKKIYFQNAVSYFKAVK